MSYIEKKMSNYQNEIPSYQQLLNQCIQKDKERKNYMIYRDNGNWKSQTEIDFKNVGNYILKDCRYINIWMIGVQLNKKQILEQLSQKQYMINNIQKEIIQLKQILEEEQENFIRTENNYQQYFMDQHEEHSDQLDNVGNQQDDNGLSDSRSDQSNMDQADIDKNIARIKQQQITGKMTLIDGNFDHKGNYAEILDNFKQQVQEVQDNLFNLLNEVPDKDIRKDSYKDFDFMMFFDYNTQQFQENIYYDKDEDGENTNSNSNFFLRMVFNIEKFFQDIFKEIYQKVTNKTSDLKYITVNQLKLLKQVYSIFDDMEEKPEEELIQFFVAIIKTINDSSEDSFQFQEWLQNYLKSEKSLKDLFMNQEYKLTKDYFNTIYAQLHIKSIIDNMSKYFIIEKVVFKKYRLVVLYFKFRQDNLESQVEFFQQANLELQIQTKYLSPQNYLPHLGNDISFYDYIRQYINQVDSKIHKSQEEVQRLEVYKNYKQSVQFQNINKINKFFRYHFDSFYYQKPQKERIMAMNSAYMDKYSKYNSHLIGQIINKNIFKNFLVKNNENISIDNVYDIEKNFDIYFDYPQIVGSMNFMNNPKKNNGQILCLQNIYNQADDDLDYNGLQDGVSQTDMVDLENDCIHDFNKDYDSDIEEYAYEENVKHIKTQKELQQSKILKNKLFYNNIQQFDIFITSKDLNIDLSQYLFCQSQQYQDFMHSVLKYYKNNATSKREEFQFKDFTKELCSKQIKKEMIIDYLFFNSNILSNLNYYEQKNKIIFNDDYLFKVKRFKFMDKIKYPFIDQQKLFQNLIFDCTDQYILLAQNKNQNPNILINFLIELLIRLQFQSILLILIPCKFMKYVFFQLFFDQRIPGESETSRQKRIDRKDLHYDVFNILILIIPILIIIYRYNTHYEGFIYVLGNKKISKNKIKTKTKDVCFLHFKDHDVQVQKDDYNKQYNFGIIFMAIFKYMISFLLLAIFNTILIHSKIYELMFLVFSVVDILISFIISDFILIISKQIKFEQQINSNIQYFNVIKFMFIFMLNYLMFNSFYILVVFQMIYQIGSPEGSLFFDFYGTTKCYKLEFIIKNIDKCRFNQLSNYHHNFNIVIITVYFLKCIKYVYLEINSMKQKRKLLQNINEDQESETQQSNKEFGRQQQMQLSQRQSYEQYEQSQQNEQEDKFDRSEDIQTYSYQRYKRRKNSRKSSGISMGSMPISRKDMSMSQNYQKQESNTSDIQAEYQGQNYTFISNYLALTMYQYQQQQQMRNYFQYNMMILMILISNFYNYMLLDTLFYIDTLFFITGMLLLFISNKLQQSPNIFHQDQSTYNYYGLYQILKYMMTFVLSMSLIVNLILVYAKHNKNISDKELVFSFNSIIILNIVIYILVLVQNPRKDIEKMFYINQRILKYIQQTLNRAEKTQS